MKVLFILASSPQTFISGSTQSLLNLISSVDGDFFLVSPINHELLNKELKSLKIKHETIPYRMFTYPRFGSLKDLCLYIPRWMKICYTSIRSYIEISKLVKEFSPDIIHTNTSTVPYGYWVAKRYHIPHIWHIREYMEKDYNLHPIPSRSYHNKRLNSSFSISITKGIADYICAGKNNRVIYNGICDSCSLTFIEEKEKYFLYVGLLDNAKGLDMVMDAYMAYYKSSDLCSPYKLLLVGEGNLRQSIENRIQIEGVEDFVKLLGGLPSEKVRQLMEKATALIMASRAEAFGRVTAEAMFAGCLVIGRDTAGTKEQLDNGLTQIGREIGLRFSNVHELSQHMFDITYKGIETYFPMIMDSQKVVRHLYTTESYAKGVKNFYKQIINNKGTK